MEYWIVYGIIAAILVSMADMIRKYLANNNKDVTFIVLLPLSIAGIISLIYILINNSKQDLQKLSMNEFHFIFILAILIVLIQYCITSCLQRISNPGYGKAIISLNTLITTLVAIYIFKTANINRYSLGGIILIIIGTALLILKSK